jgi:hypothetical protein
VLTAATDAKRLMIGHLTQLLDQCASMLPFIAKYESECLDLVRVACMDSFMIDFRALYGFMLAPLDSKRRDAHRIDYIPDWKPSWTDACRRLKEMTEFVHKHRAHLSWKRFENWRNGKDQKDRKYGIECWTPADYLDAGRLTATSYARILSDYLDVLDEFIKHLPSQSDEQQLFFGAVFNARHKVNIQPFWTSLMRWVRDCAGPVGPVSGGRYGDRYGHRRRSGCDCRVG